MLIELNICDLVLLRGEERDYGYCTEEVHRGNSF